MNVAISVQGVYKTFGEDTVLTDVSHRGRQNTRHCG